MNKSIFAAAATAFTVGCVVGYAYCRATLAPIILKNLLAAFHDKAEAELEEGEDQGYTAGDLVEAMRY